MFQVPEAVQQGCLDAALQRESVNSTFSTQVRFFLLSCVQERTVETEKLLMLSAGGRGML